METSPAGLAALALVVLWLGFWVPQQVRHRQQLADAQVGDRFSAGLRVLAVADGRGSREKERGMAETRASGGPMTGSVPLATPRTAGPPSGTIPRVRTNRLAVLERRAARARRRLVVTLALVLLTAGAWTAVGLGYLLWWAAVVPSAALAVVLVLGRVAVMTARRSDARWRAARRAEQQRATQQRTLANGGPYAPRNRARVTGRAVYPSDTRTGLIPRVQPARGSASAASAPPAPKAPAGSGTPGTTAPRGSRTPANVGAPGDPADGSRDDADPVRAERVRADSHRDASHHDDSLRDAARPVGGEPWEPVPVPLPTYVTKPSAPRREQPTTVPKHETRDVPPIEPKEPVEPVAQEAPQSPRNDTVRAEEPRPRTETLGLPLEEILARRRAAG